jgi:hypothetical protein
VAGWRILIAVIYGLCAVSAATSFWWRPRMRRFVEAREPVMAFPRTGKSSLTTTAGLLRAYGQRLTWAGRGPARARRPGPVTALRLPRWPAGRPPPIWPAIVVAGAAFLAALAVLIIAVTGGSGQAQQGPQPFATFTTGPVPALSPYATFTMVPPSTAP